MALADPMPSNGIPSEAEPPADDRELGSTARVEIKLAEVDGFEWTVELDTTLRSLATTGLPPSPSPPWQTIVKAILFNLKTTIQGYLQLGDAALFDTREEPAGGWLWTPEEVQSGLDRVCAALREFSDERQLAQAAVGPGEGTAPEPDPSQPPPEQLAGIRPAPFTIQRLAELVAHEPSSPSSSRPAVHRHYSTLPKYLRAIQRVLSVSSPVACFPINTFSLPHPGDPPEKTEPAPNGPVVNGDSAPGASAHPARLRRASTPATPTLSPIPWLVNASEDRSLSLSPEPDSQRSRHTSPLPPLAGADARPITPPLTSHLTPPRAQDRHAASSPPGRVDELDPGRGTAEEMTDGPVAIGSTALGERPAELADRLTSLPLIETPRPPNLPSETEQPIITDKPENPTPPSSEVSKDIKDIPMENT